MSSLGFDNYVEPLKLYLLKYREAAKSDKNLQQNEMTFEEASDEGYSKDKYLAYEPVLCLFFSSV